MKYITPAAQSALTPSVHASARQHFVQPVPAVLDVITVISNPNRYYTRYKLYQAFEKHMADAAGVRLWTVELALRDRQFEVTQEGNPYHIQLRAPTVLWHKENLINLAIARLPSDWEYVAWIDADVQFARPDWAVETIHQLQHYKVVQLWSHSIDLGPDFQPVGQAESIYHTYLKNHHLLTASPSARLNVSAIESDGAALSAAPEDYYYGLGPQGRGLLHTGYAWAARRSAIADLGGLGDIGILGSGDRHMAYALLGRVNESIPSGMHDAYREYWNIWQDRAEHAIRRNVGVVPGTIFHYWHGAKRNRRYKDRWKILTEHKFDPGRDIYRDQYGILNLTERNFQLRDDIRQYFAVRNEDSIDL